MPATATTHETRRRSRVFRSGNSLAVRLPAGWSKEGRPVALSREGARIVIEEEEAPKTMTELLRALAALGPSKIKRVKLGPHRPRWGIRD